jgi:hypothetical protein
MPWLLRTLPRATSSPGERSFFPAFLDRFRTVWRRTDAAHTSDIRVVHGGQQTCHACHGTDGREPKRAGWPHNCADSGCLTYIGQPIRRGLGGELGRGRHIEPEARVERALVAERLEVCAHRRHAAEQTIDVLAREKEHGRARGGGHARGSGRILE